MTTWAMFTSINAFIFKGECSMRLGCRRAASTRCRFARTRPPSGRALSPRSPHRVSSTRSLLLHLLSTTHHLIHNPNRFIWLIITQYIICTCHIICYTRSLAINLLQSVWCKVSNDYSHWTFLWIYFPMRIIIILNRNPTTDKIIYDSITVILLFKGTFYRLSHYLSMSYYSVKYGN